jgi:hypothetical protein
LKIGVACSNNSFQEAFAMVSSLFNSFQDAFENVASLFHSLEE